MLKYLLLIALGVFVWLAWRHRARPRADLTQQKAPVEQMVSCACCGVHLPLGESLVEEDRYYCCEAHRKAGTESPRT